MFTIQIRDLLANGKPEGFDYAAHSRETAPIAAARVRALMSRVGKLGSLDIGYLYEELDEVADHFDAVATDDNPQGLFNDALELLYDAGDRFTRVWVK